MINSAKGDLSRIVIKIVFQNFGHNAEIKLCIIILKGEGIIHDQESYREMPFVYMLPEVSIKKKKKKSNCAERLIFFPDLIGRIVLASVLSYKNT